MAIPLIPIVFTSPSIVLEAPCEPSPNSNVVSKDALTKLTGVDWLVTIPSKRSTHTTPSTGAVNIIRRTESVCVSGAKGPPQEWTREVDAKVERAINRP